MESGIKKKFIENISIFEIAVVIQFLFISFQNLFTIRDVLDNDMGKLFAHIAEMWKQKNIFIADWLYEDLELGFSSVFAFFIYGITKNIYVSFGLASIIFLIIYLYVIHELLGLAGFDQKAQCVAMLAFMVPYSYGQLMYTHMLFFGPGYYCIKVLVPLIALACLISETGYFRKHIPLLVLYYFLLFVTSASTGTYVFLTGLVPLIGTYAFVGCPRSREKTVFVVTSVIDALAGIAASILAPVSYAIYTSMLTSSEELHDSIAFLINRFAEMMGCLPGDSVEVSSVTGAACLLRCVFIVLFVIFTAAYFSRGLYAIYKKPKSVRDALSIYAAILLACNLLIVILTGLTDNARYLLVAICPLLIIYAAELYEKVYTVRESFVRVFMVLTLFGMLFLSDLNMAYGDPYPYSRKDSAKYDKLQEILDEYPDKNVVFFNDTGTTEIMRARNIGNDRIFITYAADGGEDSQGGFVVTDYYRSLTEPGCIEDGYLLVINDHDGEIEDLPEDMRAGYQEAGYYQNFIVYAK